MVSFSVDYILAAFLIFMRVGGMIMTAPFFSSASFPVQIKIFFAVITSLLLSFVIPAESAAVSAESGTAFIVTAIVLEALVGIALGLIGQIIFAGLELAGSLISLKITLSFAQMVDTMTEQQNEVISNIFSMLAILIFLSIDGDKVYINALARSYEVIPVNMAEIQLTGNYMLEAATYLFIIGVQIASPFLIVLFLLDLSLAIFARIMPQANIMFIAIPVKIGIGLTLMLLILPYIPDAFEIMFRRLYDFLLELMDVIAP